MKRTTPIKRRSPLKQKTPLKRSAIKRKPTKKKVPVATVRRRNKQKCSNVYSKVIKVRDGQCRNCNTVHNLQCAHLLRRSQGDWTYTRLDNAVALCRKCHVYYTHREAEWGLWIGEHFGPDHYMKLKQIASEGARKKFDWASELKRLCIAAQQYGVDCKECS